MERDVPTWPSMDVVSFIILNKDTPSISSDSLDPCYTSALFKNISNHIEKMIQRGTLCAR